MRRRALVVILGVALVFATWRTARVVDSWRYRTSLEQAKAWITSGSPAEARGLLAESAARWPREGEVKFLLGACEQALGHPDAALAAWSRVPKNSPFAGDAAMLGVRLLMKRDRFAAAEALLPAALRARGPHAAEVRETLFALFNLEGRFAEARTVVQEGWDGYPDKFGLLRQLAFLDSINPLPIEKIRPTLEEAAENAPDDDRIWLGRANLAIRTGEFAKAERWLDDCLRRRPRDAAVWKSGLDLAVATGDVVRTREALGHLPPDGVPPEEILALRAWFAARSGDQEREQQALEKMLECVPGKVQAVERLAELELLAGRPESAARLRAEGRAGSRQDSLRDARDEAQCGGSSPRRRNGAPCRGAGPVVRGPLPLVRGIGALAQRSGSPRGPVATGTSQSDPRRADPRRAPRRARPGSSPGHPVAWKPLGPTGLR